MSLRACSKSVRPRRDFDTFLTILKKMRGLFTFVKFSIYTSGLDSVKRLGFAGLVAWKSLLVIAKKFLDFDFLQKLCHNRGLRWKRRVLIERLA